MRGVTVADEPMFSCRIDLFLPQWPIVLCRFEVMSQMTPTVVHPATISSQQISSWTNTHVT